MAPADWRHPAHRPGRGPIAGPAGRPTRMAAGRNIGQKKTRLVRVATNPPGSTRSR